jgi:hypothetical protein
LVTSIEFISDRHGTPHPINSPHALLIIHNLTFDKETPSENAVTDYLSNRMMTVDFTDLEIFVPHWILFNFSQSKINGLISTENNSKIDSVCCPAFRLRKNQKVWF